MSDGAFTTHEVAAAANKMIQRNLICIFFKRSTVVDIGEVEI
jgi:hypothetical protein